MSRHAHSMLCMDDPSRHSVAATGQYMEAHVQAEWRSPMWVPVSLTSVQSSPPAVAANGTSASGKSIHEHRWVEINPVWQKEDPTGDCNTSEDKTQCDSRTTSEPVWVHNSTAVSLMKGDSGTFLSSIPDNAAGEVCHMALLQMSQALIRCT
jgi:hypothetical protein